MQIFLLLLAKILPLYVIIVLGYWAGKKFTVPKEAIGVLLIYFITPIVVFQGVITTPLSLSTLSLPVLFFLIGCLICLLFYAIGRKVWKDNTKNILAFAAGSGNTGYFGIPVALALFGQNVLGLMVLCVLGVVLFENSLGFYITARGGLSGRQAFIKLLKLPSLYAFIIGIIFSSLHFTANQNILDLLQNFKGAYTVLGMMMVGLGVSAFNKVSLDIKFLSLSFIAKFLVWPGVLGLIILIDKQLTHLYNPSTYHIFILLSIVPLAANTVAYAAALNAHPEKAGMAVLLSTLFALFYIPLIVSIFIR